MTSKSCFGKYRSDESLIPLLTRIGFHVELTSWWFLSVMMDCDFSRALTEDCVPYTRVGKLVVSFVDVLGSVE